MESRALARVKVRTRVQTVRKDYGEYRLENRDHCTEPWPVPVGNPERPFAGVVRRYTISLYPSGP